MAKSEAKKKADLKHQKSAYKQQNIMLHRENEADIIQFLDSKSNKREYLINLIRADIKKGQE